MPSPTNAITPSSPSGSPSPLSLGNPVQQVQQLPRQVLGGARIANFPPSHLLLTAGSASSTNSSGQSLFGMGASTGNSSLYNFTHVTTVPAYYVIGTLGSNSEIPSHIENNNNAQNETSR